MRAVVLDNKFLEDDIGNEFKLSSDHSRHLIKVIRIKKHEEILILNGVGQKARAKVIHIDRKVVTISLLSIENCEDKRRISLLLGLPKKDAFESIVKMAAEIGIKNIYMFHSKFTQHKIEITDRVLKIEESANIQSNNPYKINFVFVEDLESPIDLFDKVINFSTFNSGEEIKDLSGEVLLVIGPEAGFTKEEELLINSKNNVQTCMLNTNIMRAPTAFAVGSGYILGKF